MSLFKNYMFQHITRRTHSRFFSIISSSKKERSRPFIHRSKNYEIKAARSFNEQGSSNPYVIDHGNYLEVHATRWPRPLNFSYVWLRDNCRCSACYSQETFQRIKDVFEIPLNIRPSSVSKDSKELKIKWPDGHETNYDFKFLWQNTFEAKKYTLNQIEKITWDKYAFPALDLISVGLKELEYEAKAKRSLVEAILKFGVGIISDVPVSVEGTRRAVEGLCPPLGTFFGDMWTFQADSQYSDSAYSSEYLGSHTDTTYFSEACRIQVFHCLKASETGGETSLVDGFRVAQQLKQKDPECYKFLSTVPAPSEYVGDGQHHQSLDVTLKHHLVSHNLVQIRYNIYDRAPASSIPYEKMDDYYRHLRTMTSFVRKSSNEIWIKLLPGQVMLIDNWRVMHGRNSFNGSRQMTGCYLGNNDFDSKARELGFIID